MSSYKTIPGIIWRIMDDETVVVSPPIGEYCVFNGMGTVIWQMLAEHEVPTKAIKEHLTAHYSVSSEQAEQDIGQFIDQLLSKGLITEVS